MSLIRVAVAPLDFHSSEPWAPSSARKNSVPLTLVRNEGPESPAPGLMSATRTVPKLLPLDFHSSTPVVPSLARKKTVPLTLVRLNGWLLPAPGLMSTTRTVPTPSGPPLDSHSSRPLV